MLWSDPESQGNAGYFAPKRIKKEKNYTKKMQDESYTRPLSYTLSYTGNSQYIKGLSWIGEGM